MTDINLEITYDELITGINKFIREGEELTKLPHPANTAEIEHYIKNKRIWDKACYEFLLKSFSGSERLFWANAFISEKPLIIPSVQVNIQQELKRESDNLLKRINNLKYYIELLEISDAIKSPEIVKNEQRGKWGIKQKKKLLLEKLNHLYGKNVSIRFIFWANGIQSDNPNECSEIANSLESIGYVRLIPSRDTTATITSDGKEYLEGLIAEEKQCDNKNESSTYFNQEDYTNEFTSRYNYEEMNTKIDEILEKLNRTELGEELIFDEIQELKDLVKVLNKKNFAQILKGKLLDLTANKIAGLGIEAAKHIYTDLTGNHLDKLIN